MEEQHLAQPRPRGAALDSPRKPRAGGKTRGGRGAAKEKGMGQARELQQSQECTKNHLSTADMHPQAPCFQGREWGAGRGRGAAGATPASPQRPAPGPALPPHNPSSFLFLLNHFLSGPGSPEDCRVRIGDLIEGCGDCPRFKLEPRSLCSFLFCRFSEIHVGAAQGGAVPEATPHGRACSPVPRATATPAS